MRCFAQIQVASGNSEILNQMHTYAHIYWIDTRAWACTCVKAHTLFIGFKRKWKALGLEPNLREGSLLTYGFRD